MKYRLAICLLVGLFLISAQGFPQDPDPNFHIYLAFGQSNMEGFPGLEEKDKEYDNDRFQVLAAVDFPELDRQKGNWYTAVPPLCRPSSGLSPADYFGRTMVANLPQNIKVGVVNVAVAGSKIELFQKSTYKEYASTAPGWMRNIIKQYDGNPYRYLVDLAKRAQQDGVIKGILLHQGESNNGDTEWPDKVKDVYENLIGDLNLNAEEVPLLAGEVVHVDQDGATAGMNKIIDTLPEVIPTAHVVSSSGAPARKDNLHFTPEGYRILGSRYTVKMLSLMGYKVDELEHVQTQ